MCAYFRQCTSLSDTVEVLRMIGGKGKKLRIGEVVVTPGYLTLWCLRADRAKSWRSRFLGGEGEKTSVGEFQWRLWVLYRLHSNPPDVLSNYHLVLPHVPPYHHSEAFRPHDAHPTAPEMAEEGFNKRGYKAMVTPVSFSNNLRDHLWSLDHPCYTHTSSYTHTVASRVEGCYGTFNSLFREMKNSEAVRASPNDIHDLLAAIAPWNEDESKPFFP